MLDSLPFQQLNMVTTQKMAVPTNFNLNMRLQQLASFDNDHDSQLDALNLLSSFESEIFTPQGEPLVSLGHKIQWEAGDRILNGITNLFSNFGSSKPTPVDPTEQTQEESFAFQDLFSNISVITCPLMIILLISYKIRGDRASLILVMLLLSFEIINMIAHSQENVKLLNTLLGQWTSLRRELSDNENSPNGDDFTEDEILKMEDTFAPQGFSDSAGLFSEILVSFISLGLGFRARDPFLNFVSNFIKFSERQKDNLSSTLLKVSSSLHDFFTNTLTCDTLAEYFYVDVISDQEVRYVVNKLNMYIASSNAGISYCEGYQDEIFAALKDQVKSTLKRLDKQSFDYKTLFKSFNEAEKLSLQFKTFSLALSGDRIEPVGVLFRGKPGTFKTVLMDRVTRLVSRYTLPDLWREEFESSPNSFFFPLPNDKFFDGYTYRAWVTTIDDVFQRREVAGDTDPESLKVIKMINSAPYLLPMAAADAKNSKYFRSAFVMATTNLHDFSALQSIADPFAVARRFTVTVDISVNPKYTDVDGLLSYDKIPSLSIALDDVDETTVDHTVIPNDFWKINLTRYNASQKSESKDISFEELIDVIITCHRSKIKDFYVNKRTTETCFDEIKSKLDDKYLSKKALPQWRIPTTPSLIIPQSGLVVTNERVAMLSYIQNHGYEIDAFVTYTELELKAVIRDMENGTVPRIDVIPGQFPNTSYVKTNFKIWGSLMILVLAMECDVKAFQSMFYDLCREQDRLDWYTPECHNLEMHLSLLTEAEQNNFTDLLKGDLLEVYDFLQRTFWQFTVQKKSPITGKYESLFICCQENGRIMLNKIVRFFTPVYRFIKQNFTFLVLGMGTIVTVSYFLYRAFRTIILPESQSVDTGRMMSRSGAKRGLKIKLSEFPKELSLAPQGIDIPSYDTFKFPSFESMDFGRRNGTNDIMSKIHNKYFFIIYLLYKNKNSGKIDFVRMGHCTNLVSNYFIMPFHFIYQIHAFSQDPVNTSIQVILMNSTKSITYRMPANDFIKNFETSDISADRDQCVVYVPVAQRTSTGILKYVLRDADLDNLQRRTSFQGVLVGTSHKNSTDTSLVMRINTVSTKFITKPVDVCAVWDDKNPVYSLERVASYETELSNGDCGSLLFCKSGNFQNRVLLGMHVAGRPDYGFSTIFTYEELMKMIDDCAISYTSFDDEEEPSYLTPELPISSQGGLHHTGRFDNKHTVNTVSKSEIKKSRFHGQLPAPYDQVTTLPAKLWKFTHNDIEIDPSQKAISNYGKTPSCIPYSFINSATANYEQRINNASKAYVYSRDKIDLSEALHSFRSVKTIASSTSAGFPMNLTGIENLKDKYYKACQERNEVLKLEYYQRIALEVDIILDLYKNKKRPFFVYSDCLKDETRPRDKVLSGNTRMFSGSPFIMLVMFRMYFGAFIDMFFSANIEIGSAICVNPYSQDWDSMVRHLGKFGKLNGKIKVGAGDYSKFDCHLQPFMLNACLDIIQQWYGLDNKDNIIRSFLWAEVSNSKHIFYGLFYDWFSSMPSGNPMTAIINTMCNNLVFRIAYQFAGYDVESFSDHVYICALGDDNIFSVSPFVYDDFNELTMPGLMKSCGMIYTTETKGTASSIFRNLEDVEFLKRTFRFEPRYHRWVAPLNINSITEMLNWTKKGLLGDQIAVDNCAVALREFSLHGSKVYNYWYPIIHRLWFMHYENIEMTSPISSQHSVMMDKAVNHEWTY